MQSVGNVVQHLCSLKPFSLDWTVGIMNSTIFFYELFNLVKLNLRKFALDWATDDDVTTCSGVSKHINVWRVTEKRVTDVKLKLYDIL